MPTCGKLWGPNFKTKRAKMQTMEIANCLSLLVAANCTSSRLVKKFRANPDLGRVLPGIAQWRQQMPCRFAEAQGNDHWRGEGWTKTEENKHSTRQPYLLQINARCAFEGCRTTNILATGHRQDQALYKRKNVAFLWITMAWGRRHPLASLGFEMPRESFKGILNLFVAITRGKGYVWKWGI